MGGSNHLHNNTTKGCCVLLNVTSQYSGSFRFYKWKSLFQTTEDKIYQ